MILSDTPQGSVEYLDADLDASTSRKMAEKAFDVVSRDLKNPTAVRHDILGMSLCFTDPDVKNSKTFVLRPPKDWRESESQWGDDPTRLDGLTAQIVAEIMKLASTTDF